MQHEFFYSIIIYIEQTVLTEISPIYRSKFGSPLLSRTLSVVLSVTYMETRVLFSFIVPLAADTGTASMNNSVIASTIKFFFFFMFPSLLFLFYILIIAHEVLFVRICLGSDKNNISVFSSVIRKIIQIYQIYRRICFIIKCYCNLVPQIFSFITAYIKTAIVPKC